MELKKGDPCNVCMSNLISKQIKGEQQLRPAVATSLWHKSERIVEQDIRVPGARAGPPLMMINAMLLEVPPHLATFCFWKSATHSKQF